MKAYQLMSAIFLAVTAQMASAIPVTVEGFWHLTGGTDALGLDGTSFHYRVEPGAPASLYTYPSGSESTLFEVGTRTLSLSGTMSDGTFSNPTIHQSTTLLDATSVDRITLGGSAYYAGDYRVEIPTITIQFDGDFVTGPGIDDIPNFSQADYNNIVLGGWGGVNGMQLWTETQRIATYIISDSSAYTPLPGPATWVILLFGILLLVPRHALEPSVT